MTDLTWRRLGGTGFEVSPIGIGTGSLGAVPELSDPGEIDRLAVKTLPSTDTISPLVKSGSKMVSK